MSLVESYCSSPPDLLGVDHMQGTVEISIHEFTPFGSSDYS